MKSTLLTVMLLALAVPVSAQQQLTFQWPAFSHPQFAEYAWALYMDGAAVQVGRTTATQVTVTVPATPAEYYVNVSWLHRQNGKLTFLESTATQSIAGPEPPEPDPDPPATHSVRIGLDRAHGVPALATVDVCAHEGSILDALAAQGWLDDPRVDVDLDRDGECARLIGLPDQPPPDSGNSGPIEPPEWLTVDFGDVGPWYVWQDAGTAHVADGELVVDLAPDTEGYAGISVAGVDLRGAEVVAHIRETPARVNTESWLVVDDGNRRYYVGRANGYRTVAVVDAQGYTMLDYGGWRNDWDMAIRHEGGELLFQNVRHSDGGRNTRYRVPLDIDLSNVTISLMAGSQAAIRLSNVGTARWSGLTVRPVQP